MVTDYAAEGATMCPVPNHEEQTPAMRAVHLHTGPGTCLLDSHSLIGCEMNPCLEFKMELVAPPQEDGIFDRAGLIAAFSIMALPVLNAKIVTISFYWH